MGQWKVLTVSHIAAAAAGFWVAPREMLDKEVKQAGLFTVDTKRVLSATVESLRAENKLLAYSYKGESDVSVERSAWWVLHGSQELLVPATVSYYVDLSNLTLDRVKYDDVAKIVTVSLPALTMGDVAFEPEAARMINGGLLTYNQATVDELSRLNYGSARKAFVKQAQGATLVRAAQGEAIKDVQAAFEIPLRIVGKPDVKVVATFDTP